VPNAGKYLGGIGFYFHAAAAAVTLLAPPQVWIDIIRRKGQARRHTIHNHG
jgi:hypothetical protein